jgi:hypothetical protein
MNARRVAVMVWSRQLVQDFLPPARVFAPPSLPLFGTSQSPTMNLS